MVKYAVTNQMTRQDVKAIRKKLKLSQAELAGLLNVSVKTIERWEQSEQFITGSSAVLLQLLDEHPELERKMRIPDKEYPMRLWFYCGNHLCSVIDVDERRRLVKVYNYTNNNLMRAFGRNDSPEYADYETFLESRCFPESRDKMKLMLEKLDLPFYDPLLIIEKTQGRMADDNCWIRIER